jgi:hypothetical protein
MKELTVRRLSTPTVYCLFFVGLLCGALPIFLMLGVLSYFGISTLTWNDKPLTGVSALLGGPFIGLFIALLGTAFFGTIAAVGLWIYSKFSTLKIQYEEPRQRGDADNCDR